MTEKFRFELPAELEGVSAVKTVVKKPRVRKQMVSLEGVVGSHVDSTKYRGNGHWQFDENMGSPEYVGFIYVIRDVVNDKLYLGKKQYKSVGKLTRGKESNWRWYISSSNELSESIKANGKHNFEFVAIAEYKTKGGLSYAESWSLFHVQAPVNRDKWYNLLINKVSWVVKEPVSAKHRARLKMMLIAVGVKLNGDGCPE